MCGKSTASYNCNTIFKYLPEIARNRFPQRLVAGAPRRICKSRHRRILLRRASATATGNASIPPRVERQIFPSLSICWRGRANTLFEPGLVGDAPMTLGYTPTDVFFKQMRQQKPVSVTHSTLRTNLRHATDALYTRYHTG
jgi:hypothetical protein